jgi:hypothetical protein
MNRERGLLFAVAVVSLVESLATILLGAGNSGSAILNTIFPILLVISIPIIAGFVLAPRITEYGLGIVTLFLLAYSAICEFGRFPQLALFIVILCILSAVIFLAVGTGANLGSFLSLPFRSTGSTGGAVVGFFILFIILLVIVPLIRNIFS